MPESKEGKESCKPIRYSKGRGLTNPRPLLNTLSSVTQVATLIVHLPHLAAKLPMDTMDSSAHTYCAADCASVLSIMLRTMRALHAIMILVMFSSLCFIQPQMNV